MSEPKPSHIHPLAKCHILTGTKCPSPCASGAQFSFTLPPEPNVYAWCRLEPLSCGPHVLDSKHSLLSNSLQHCVHGALKGGEHPSNECSGHFQMLFECPITGEVSEGARQAEGRMGKGPKGGGRRRAQILRGGRKFIGRM